MSAGNENTGGSGEAQPLVVPEISPSSLVNAGVRIVRRHPVPSAAYAAGLLICIFFTGSSLTELQRREFQEDVSRVDYEALDRAHAAAVHWNHRYRESKGFFFSCNEVCQENYEKYEAANQAYLALKKNEADIVSDAKSKIGIFSELGVQETRAAFWERYSQGKGFAEQQTKFDAAFFGFRSMMRDESLTEYVITMLFRVLFNFTLGVVATVATFMWSSISVIRSFQASPVAGIVFFVGALLAALSFAASWLMVIFAAVGGTAYATIRLAAANMRIEGGPRARNIRYTNTRHRD